MGPIRTQVGLGVAVASVATDTSQGSLTSTGQDTDLAIQGNGYFLLGDGSNTYYSRDGSFTLDANNDLVSADSGYKVLGWTADATGNIDTSQAPSTAGIVIPGGSLSNAQQTTEATFGENLDAGAKTGANVSPDVNVYDSLGVSHEIEVTFTKTASPSEWSYSVYCPDVGTSAVTSGNLQFDANGVAETDQVPVSLTFKNPDGSTSPMAFDLSFGQIKQEAGSSTVCAVSQNGVSAGTLQSFSIGPDGTISGSYEDSSDNATKQVLGRIALADFSNPSGLVQASDNSFSIGPNSGLAQVAPAATGSRGTLAVGFLESSNVDLSTEFTNMIVAQRGFEANSKVITVSDQVLQDLVNLRQG